MNNSESRDYVRRLTQLAETVEPEELVEITPESDLYKALDRNVKKTRALTDAIEEASKDLYIHVRDEDVQEAMQAAFPDDPTHANGTICTFAHYKSLLDRTDAANNHKDPEILEHVMRRQYPAREPGALSWKEKQLEIGKLNSPFGAVQLAAAASMLFLADHMRDIALKSTNEPNPGGAEGETREKKLDAIYLLSMTLHGKKFLDEFANQFIQIGREPGSSSYTPTKRDLGSYGIQDKTLGTFQEYQGEVGKQTIIRYAHSQLPEKLQEDEHYQAWANYLPARYARKEAEQSLDLGSLRLSSESRPGPQTRAGTILANRAMDGAQDVFEYASNLENSYTPLYKAGASMVDTELSFAERLDGLADNMHAFLTSHYGADSICCLLRLTGANLDGAMLQNLGRLMQLFNMTTPIKVGDVLDDLFDAYNSMIEDFVTKILISQIERLFTSFLSRVNRQIRRWTESDEKLDIILTCPPVADLIALLKQLMLQLKNALIDLLKELANKLKVQHDRIEHTLQITTDIKLAGKFGKILERLGRIIDDCDTDNPDRTFARQLVDKLGTYDEAAIKVEDPSLFNPVSVTTPSGLHFTGGLHTSMPDSVEDDVDDAILDACIGGVTADDVLSLAQEVNFIARRMREVDESI